MIPALLTAFQALGANKLRSALTMLGTVIGVTCVVALWNTGASGRGYIALSLSSIGQNIIMVRAKYDASDTSSPPHFRYRPLKLREYEAVRDRCPSGRKPSSILVSYMIPQRPDFSRASRACFSAGVNPPTIWLKRIASPHG